MPEDSKFLNKRGLSDLWAKIKSLVMTKQDNLTAEDYLPTGTDLNNVVENGFYSLSGNYSYSNLPPLSGNQWGELIVFKCKADGARKWQRFYKGTSEIYERHYFNSAWSSWTRIAVEDDIPTKTSDLTNDSINQYSYPISSASAAVASSTSYSELAHTTSALPAGTYLILAMAYFSSDNATGRRGIRISTSSTGGRINYFLEQVDNALNGASTFVKVVGTVNITESTTLYLQVYQNSLENVTVQGRLQYIKLV